MHSNLVYRCQCFRKCSDAPETMGKHAAAPRGVPSAEVQAADQTAVPEAARAQAGRLQQHVRLPPGISRLQRVCTDIVVEDEKGLQAGGLHLQVRPFLKYPSFLTTRESSACWTLYRASHVLVDLAWVDLDLGSSPGWWAATVATYCPSRVVKHPKSKSTKPSLRGHGTPCMLIVDGSKGA